MQASRGVCPRSNAPIDFFPLAEMRPQSLPEAVVLSAERVRLREAAACEFNDGAYEARVTELRANPRSSPSMPSTGRDAVFLTQL